MNRYWVLDNFLKPKSRLPLPKKEIDLSGFNRSGGGGWGHYKLNLSLTGTGLGHEAACPTEGLKISGSRTLTPRIIFQVTGGIQISIPPLAAAISSKQSQEGFIQGILGEKTSLGSKNSA